MKRMASVAAILATLVLLPLGSAQAASLSPTSTNYSLSGTFIVNVFGSKYTCTLNNFTGTIKSDGTGTIDNGDFTGGLRVCPFLTQFQPWKITATGSGTVKLDVQLYYSGAINPSCNNWDIPATLVNGVLSFPETGPSSCKVGSAGITLSPTISAIP